MEKRVKIEGLDCPNCAKSLECEINKLNGVKNAKIDFLKSEISFESAKVEQGLNKIIKLTKKLEPNAKIYEERPAPKKLKVSMLLDIICLVLGIALAVIILTVKMPTPLYWSLYALAALSLGWKTYYKAFMLLIKGKINENLLITISVIGATFVSEHLEGLMVIALYSIGKIFEGLALSHSRKSIESLAKLQPEYATLYEDGKETRLSPDKIEVGQIIIVKPGEKVPIDGVIIEGESEFNMQSLTGESVPVRKTLGEEILSGAIALTGVVQIKTVKLYSDSTISKIMELVENNAAKKSKTETFISKLTKYYTLGIIVLALLVWGITWAVTGNINSAIYRGLIFLVISCPCAFAISVPLTYFSGLGNASRNGILIKGSNYLDECAKLKIVAFDKTGTLTSGEFAIKNIETYDIDKLHLIRIAAIGERNSIHPLAKAIVNYAKSNNLPIEENIENYKEESGKGISFILDGKQFFVGRRDANLKSTMVEVYEKDKLLGRIELQDEIKESAIEVVDSLKQMGIKTYMLSGDNSEIAQSVAEKLKIDECRSELLPEDKFNIINELQKDGHLGYVGDGINDSPSLTAASVGFSMGINGAQASIDASDIVLVDDDVSKIVKAINISKKTKRIVIENIALSAGIKIIFLLLGSIGITGMLSAVFADVGVTLLAIFNSLRALKNKKEINS